MSTHYARRKRAFAARRALRGGNSSQQRGQKARARRRRPIAVRRIECSYRTTRILRRDMHVRYAPDVSGRSIDRDAWADVVAQLIRDETDGNTTRFASLVGTTYRTVRRWLTKGGDVSEESVRQVARAVHIPAALLLVRVGYLDGADLATAAEITPADAGGDRALQVILAADVPPRIKQRMIQRLQQLRAQEAERHVDEVQWWIDQARGA